MENARYHLVFEGFLKDVNKTEIGLSLKTQLSLTDAQIADLMAGRRTVLKDKLPKEEAMSLGKQLTKIGLKIKAQALAVHQKNDPDVLRKHLLDGGIDQYFASRFRHPDEEMDTQVSLVILAAFAVVTYFVLPLIGLRILVPLLSLSLWTDQTFPAFIQTSFALLCFVPAIWLRPKPAKIDGIVIDYETEELMLQLITKLSNHLSAPHVQKIILVENPVLKVHQSPTEWLQNRSTLEVGLPILEALNMQQFVGLLAMRLVPLSTRLYARTWGLFIQWYNPLRTRYKPWALLLNNWVLPIHQHQQERAEHIARTLVGVQETIRLSRIEKRFAQLDRDWPEFLEFCTKLRVKGTNWEALFAKEAQSSKKTDEQYAAFRIDAPSLWILSTTTGYQRSFTRQAETPLFELQGAILWQQFQKLVPHVELFERMLVKPEALVPPLEVPKKKRALNALRLNKQAADVLAAQKQAIEQAIAVNTKQKKAKDIASLVSKWRTTSANFWPEDFLKLPLFPLAKSLFLSVQTLQQIQQWNINPDAIEVNKMSLRNKQVESLHKKWLDQTAKIPAFPLLGSDFKRLQDQLQQSFGKETITEATSEEILTMNEYWLNFLLTYWTFVSGQLFKPKTLVDSQTHEEAPQ